jgi:hypothetical protein
MLTKPLKIYCLQEYMLLNPYQYGSYQPYFYKSLILLVPPARIELAAHGLGIHCSIH